MDKLTKIQKAGFYLALIVALSISWWSITTLGTDFFKLPLLLAIGASAAFDGAALFVAGLASNYARSEDSGTAARLATIIFVAASAYLNVMHANMLGFGLPGMFFLGAPPIIAGILFELYLKYEHRKALRERGRVVDAMPVLGKLTWAIYPGPAFKVVKKVLADRLMRVANGLDQLDTAGVFRIKGERLARAGDAVAAPVAVATRTTPVRAVEAPTAVPAPTGAAESRRRGRSRKQTPALAPAAATAVAPVSDLSDSVFAGIDKSASHSRLVRHLMEQGIEDKATIINAVSQYSGKPVNPNSFAKFKQRFKEAQQSTPGYL